MPLTRLSVLRWLLVGSEHVRAAGRAAAETITWREGSKGTMSSQFIVLRVRPSGHLSPATPTAPCPSGSSASCNDSSRRGPAPASPATNP